MKTILGIYLLLLGILLDDVTSLIILSRDAGAESNPLFLMFGFWGYIAISLLIYAFIIFVWVVTHRKYHKMYSLKQKGYKTYDILIFLFCVFLMFLVITKVEMGFNNIGLMTNYMGSQDSRDKLEGNATIAMEFQKAEPERYDKEMGDYYKQTVLYNIGYLKMWLYIIFGYLLFRVGYRVSPYDES